MILIYFAFHMDNTDQLYLVYTSDKGKGVEKLNLQFKYKLERTKYR